MRLRSLTALFLLLLAQPSAFAWNAAGHRLSAMIAWQYMQPATREFVMQGLAAHPDYVRWQEKARPGEMREILAEAACWPDQIRQDPRFYDETREPPGPPVDGLPDHAKHKRWHYVDLDAAGAIRAGELDGKIAELDRLLRSTADPAEIAWALPWLIHLVGDIHQPLHVGRHGDEGGNTVDVEIPFDARQTRINLHQYWDELPGPGSLRGKKLEQSTARLLESHEPPRQETPQRWRNESHRLLAQAYPPGNDGKRAIVDEDFDRRARAIADQRIVDAGRRLAHLLDRIAAARVSRGTR